MVDFSSETTGARRQNTEGKKKSVNQDSISSKAMLQKWEKLKHFQINENWENSSLEDLAYKKYQKGFFRL